MLFVIYRWGSTIEAFASPYLEVFCKYLIRPEALSAADSVLHLFFERSLLACKMFFVISGWRVCWPAKCSLPFPDGSLLRQWLDRISRSMADSFYISNSNSKFCGRAAGIGVSGSMLTRGDRRRSKLVGKMILKAQFQRLFSGLNFAISLL